jgi:hypothetical protein
MDLLRSPDVGPQLGDTLRAAHRVASAYAREPDERNRVYRADDRKFDALSAPMGMAHRNIRASGGARQPIFFDAATRP